MLEHKNHTKRLSACQPQLSGSGNHPFRPNNYRPVPARGPVAPAQLSADLCPDVCLIKLVPGTKPELLAAVKTLGYRGVVIEGFGAGGVPFTGRNLVPKIEELLQAGIAVVITTQCPYGGADLTLYEVGQKALKTGAIPAYDMAGSGGDETHVDLRPTPIWLKWLVVLTDYWVKSGSRTNRTRANKKPPLWSYLFRLGPKEMSFSDQVTCLVFFYHGSVLQYNRRCL